MTISLIDLDQKAVAVEVTMPDAVRVLRGRGFFARDAVLGDCLRILVDEPGCGELEILLKSGEWCGAVDVDDRHGCDYRVQLDAACLLQ